MIILFDNSPFQNTEKLKDNFKDINLLFNLNDLCKLIFAKKWMTDKTKWIVKPIQSKTKFLGKLKNINFFNLAQHVFQQNFVNCSLIQYVINWITLALSLKNLFYMAVLIFVNLDKD